MSRARYRFMMTFSRTGGGNSAHDVFLDIDACAVDHLLDFIAGDFLAAAASLGAYVIHNPDHGGEEFFLSPVPISQRSPEPFVSSVVRDVVILHVINSLVSTVGVANRAAYRAGCGL